MAADHETALIIDAVKTLERKMEKASDEGRVSTNEVHTRINQVLETTQNGFRELSNKIASGDATLSAHMSDDMRRFDEHATEIREARNDRKGMWTMLAGGGASGGIIAALIEMLRHKGGG